MHMTHPTPLERTIRKIYQPGDQRRVMWGAYELLRRIEERYVKKGLITPAQFHTIGNYVSSYAFTKREGGYRLPTREELFTRFPRLERRRAALRRVRRAARRSP